MYLGTLVHVPRSHPSPSSSPPSIHPSHHHPLLRLSQIFTVPAASATRPSCISGCELHPWMYTGTDDPQEMLYFGASNWRQGPLLHDTEGWTCPSLSVSCLVMSLNPSSSRQPPVSQLQHRRRGFPAVEQVTPAICNTKIGLV